MSSLNLFIFTFVIIGLATVQCCHQNRYITKKTAVTRKPPTQSKSSAWSKIIRPFKKATTPATADETVDYIVETVLVSECCAGYEMTTQNRCTPSCPMGCPTNATCVLPSKCQCNDGYSQLNSTDDQGSTIRCQPDCSGAPCPENSECIAPNQCACDEGYLRQGFNCLRLCTSDDCVRGKCKEDLNKCVCSAGYVHDEELGLCVVDSSNQAEDDEEEIPKIQMQTELQQSTTNEPADEDDEAAEDEEDEEEEETERDNENDDDSSTATYPTTDLVPNTNCPEGFIQHKGDCRPILDDAEFAICQKGKCKLNSICSANGECICKTGYQKSSHDECVSLEAAFKDDGGQSFDYFHWINWCLVAVVCFAVLGILIKVTGRFLVQKGHFEVKDKQYGYDVEYKKGNKEQCAV